MVRRRRGKRNEERMSSGQGKGDKKSKKATRLENEKRIEEIGKKIEVRKTTRGDDHQVPPPPLCVR